MSSRARFTIAAATGAGLGAIWFLWMLTAGTFDLFAWRQTADFYDAQAHSLLDGRLDVPASVMGIEGFAVDGKTYMYQGPMPAIVRLPIAMFTRGLDGRLSALAMLVAFAVAVVASLHILWQIRTRVRGDAPVGAVETGFVGLWAFVLAGGSTLLFTASRSYVYHESLLWALAFALASFDAMLAWAERPTRGRLVLAGVFAGMALLSRASVGLGPVVALGIFALVALVRRWRTRRTDAPSPTTRRIVALCLVAGAPVVVYCAINLVKFGTLTAVPWKDQVYSSIVTERQEFLAENGGDFFGVKFVPETAQRYLRPDALSVTKTFPFIDFEQPPQSPVVGGVRFDTFDVSASLTATLPFLWLLALVGLVVLVRRSDDRTALAPVRIPAVGAALGAVAIFPFGYVAQRYLGDALPLLVMLGSCGLVVCTRPAPALRVWRAVALAAIGVAAVWTVAANSALAVSYQRQYSNPPLDEGRVARYVDRRVRIAHTYLEPEALPVVAGDRAPAWGPAGQLFIAGDCDGLYLSDGLRIDQLKVSSFRPVERRSGAGRFTLRVVPERTARGTRVPLLTGGGADTPFDIWVERRDGDRAVIGYDGPGVEPTESEEFDFPVGRATTLEVAADPNIRRVDVSVDGRGLLGTYFNSAGPYRVGRSTGSARLEPSFAGSIDVLARDMSICRRLQGLARPAG